MGPPRRFLTVLCILGAFALGAFGGFLWKESAATCALSAVLLEDIRSMMVDGRAVVSDPFVEHALRPDDAFKARIGLERALARRILSRFGRFHLSLAFIMDLGKVPELDVTSLETYVKGLEAWRRTLHDAPDIDSLVPVSLPGMPGLAPGEPQSREPWYSDPVLARAGLRELAASDHRKLEDALKRVPALKVDWAADSTVYCRSMLTLRRMALVQETQKQGCDKSAAKTKASCAKAALARFQSEVDELQRVKILNERKLMTKWGPRLYAGFHCD